MMDRLGVRPPFYHDKDYHFLWSAFPRWEVWRRRAGVVMSGTVL